METLKAMWAGLDNTGRIVLIVGVVAVIVASLVTGNVIDFSFLVGG
jgi:hypothetical protein